MKQIFNSRLLKLFIVLIVGGAIFFVLGLLDFIDSNKTPIDYNTMTEDQVQKGAIVEGDIYYNYGPFEQIDTKENGRTTGTSYRYVIPVGEEGYVGIDISNKDTISEMDKQTDETFDMIDGKRDNTETVVHFKGKIQKMTKEDYGYFVDFMKSGGFTDEEIEKYGSEYYIQIRLFGQGKYIMIVGAVLFIIGIIILVITLKQGRGPKPAPMAPQNPEQYGQSLQDPSQYAQGQMQDPSQYAQAPQQTSEETLNQSFSDNFNQF